MNEIKLWDQCVFWDICNILNAPKACELLFLSGPPLPLLPDTVLPDGLISTKSLGTTSIIIKLKHHQQFSPFWVPKSGFGQDIQFAFNNAKQWAAASSGAIIDVASHICLLWPDRHSMKCVSHIFARGSTLKKLNSFLR